MRNCILIKNDLFDIVKRLKEIDKGYFVVRKNGRFEVHNSLQGGGSFCLAVPYPNLDCRTINLVRRTRSERATEFLHEIEQENNRINKELIYQESKKAEKLIDGLLH